MSSRIVFTLGFLAATTVALGCGDSGSSDNEVPGDPDASWVMLSEMTFGEIIPDIVSFATPWGDIAAGPHTTFARVSAGMGIPPHLHSSNIRSVVFDAPMEIPVPSNETEPGSLTLGSYMFVPGMNQHAMTGAHGTIARVKAGTGIPPHWHSLEVRGYVLQGMVEVPVPFDQTNPVTMTPCAFFLVPAEAGHAMNCVSASMDCLFLMVQEGAFDVTFLDI
jgi:hypothetical protein